MDIKTVPFVLIILLFSGCSTMRTQQSQTLVKADTNTDTQYVKDVISKQEEENGIPKGILSSIASVESQYRPYAINTKAKSHNFNSKSQAVEFVENNVKRRNTNISVGCLQLHYRAHRSQFSSVDSMLTPENNISYGARLLKSLYNRFGSWEKAIKFYHSTKAKYNRVYYRKVMKKYNSIAKSH